MSEDILSVVGAVSKELLARGFTPQSVSAALARVGRGLGVDRVYIFENGVNAKREVTCSQRFEWSSSAVSAQIDNPELQDLAYSDIGPSWLETLANDQVICGPTRAMETATRAILESQDILSILVCPITLGNQWWGFVGFDDCHSERPWTESEVTVLKMLARALGGALRQAQMKQMMPFARKQLESVAAHCGPAPK